MSCDLKTEKAQGTLAPVLVILGNAINSRFVFRTVDFGRVISRVISYVPKCTQMYHFECFARKASENRKSRIFGINERILEPDPKASVGGSNPLCSTSKKSDFSGFFIFHLHFRLH